MKMLRIELLRLNSLTGRLLVPYFRNYASEVPLELDEGILEEKNVEKENEIEMQRNKSRLAIAHFNIMHGKTPYPEPKHWSHFTTKYQRKLYGKYGSISNVNPSICWMDRNELSSKLEYMKIKEDRTILEMVEEAKQKRLKVKSEIRERDADVANKVLKIAQWEKELKARVQKKEAEALAAKQKKEKLIEEVRRHFGFRVDPKDERFKEMLAQKEKDQKKADKVAKKSAKEAKMLALLQEKTEEMISKPS